MATKIQLRRDTAANWTSNNPVLAIGEFGVELDTNMVKIGDGTTAWAALEYFTVVAASGLTNVDGAVTLGGTVTDDTAIIGDGNNLLLLNKPLSQVGSEQVVGVAINGSTSVQILAFDATGANSNLIDITPTSTQISLFSPNGTKYQLAVDNDGVVSGTAA